MTSRSSSSGTASTDAEHDEHEELSMSDHLAAEATTESPTAHHHGYISDKDRYLARLKRIEGQVRGVQRMVEQDVYCIDILTQISAVTAAVENVALGLLEDHLKHCVVDAARAGGPEAEARIAEASAAIARLVKS